MSEPFIAEIRMFAGNFAPEGWAHCDGALLPIAQNTALFSLIGTTYGGDGETTTALPNLQGRVPMHAGRGPGLTDRRLGERLGQARVTLAASQLPGHTHTLRAAEEDATSTDPTGRALAIADSNTYRETGTDASMHADAIGDAGGGGAHENRQPYLVMRFIIALTGTYPSAS